MLREQVAATQTAVTAIPEDDENSACTLEQHSEQIADAKSELKDVRASTLEIELATEDPIVGTQVEIECMIFRCSVDIKKRLCASVHTTTHDTPPSAPRTSGAKLPKLEVPTFDGDLLKWKSFWDQFSISIRNCTDLINAEKMVNLQNALKDHIADYTIEGLTKSGEHYNKAVQCLKTCYDRPGMVHQTHVRWIV